jgi:hypothetical protein
MIRQMALTFLVVTTLHAQHALAWDDKRQLAKQVSTHEQAKQRGIHAFALGDQKAMEEAAADIAASESYLAILGFNPSDQRLVGNLWTEDMRGTADTPEFWSKVFYQELERRTGFKPDVRSVFTETRFYRVKPVQHTE